MNDPDLKRLYEDMSPSPWAVGKLRTRIEAMQADPFDAIWTIFSRRVSVGMAAALAIVIVLNMQMTTIDETTFDTELHDVLGTNRGDFLSSTIPDYTHVLD